MLKFWELAPSPNAIKVRLALRTKGIPFEVVEVDPQDRNALVEVSGQELMPVIEDKSIVLNDSEAIINYLDANYRDAPRLQPQQRARRAACDAWKERLDREVALHWVSVFLFAIGRRDNLDKDARARYQAALEALDGELVGKDSFHENPEMIVCDIRVAEWSVYGLPGAELISRVPLFKRFREVFAVDPAKLPNLQRFLAPWNERLA